MPTGNPPRSPLRRLLDAMIAEFKKIHTDRGDSFTPVSVQRMDRNRASEGQSPSILISTLTDEKSRGEDSDTSSPWIRTATVLVRVYLLTAGDLESASDEQIDEAQEDIFRAMLNLDWETLQMDFMSMSAEDFTEIEEEPGTRDGFMATITVDHKTAYDNPDVTVF